jgi:hypothetical protein
MPQAAIEALQRMFGKAPDQQRTRGSNYGKLDHDFTFPPRQSTAGKSKETKEKKETKEETAASSSKVNEDTKEVDLDEFERKERRRKSNLNVFATEFTPSFFSGSSLTDSNKSDSDIVEDRKKKGKKEKVCNLALVFLLVSID